MMSFDLIVSFIKNFKVSKY